MVDQNCHARLADFGLLTIIPESTTSSSFRQGGTVRWMSPELFDPKIEDRRRTKYSDCYALGMVIYEVLGRRVPFHQDPDLVVVIKVVNGDRPERPRGVEGVVWFTDDVWRVLELCWTPRPENRPSIEDVLHCMEKVARSWTPPRRTDFGRTSILSVRLEILLFPSSRPYVPFQEPGYTRRSQNSRGDLGSSWHLADACRHAGTHRCTENPSYEQLEKHRVVAQQRAAPPIFAGWKVPSDLVEAILSHLPSDTPTLQACSLVAKSCVPWYREHSFFQVRFNPDLFPRWCRAFPVPNVAQTAAHTVPSTFSRPQRLISLCETYTILLQHRNPLLGIGQP